MVTAIGTGDVFSKGRDFGAWLGLETASPAAISIRSRNGVFEASIVPSSCARFLLNRSFRAHVAYWPWPLSELSDAELILLSVRKASGNDPKAPKPRMSG